MLLFNLFISFQDLVQNYQSAKEPSGPKTRNWPEVLTLTLEKIGHPCTCSLFPYSLILRVCAILVCACSFTLPSIWSEAMKHTRYEQVINSVTQSQLHQCDRSPTIVNNRFGII